MFTTKRTRCARSALAVVAALTVAAACSDDADMETAGTDSEADSRSPAESSDAAEAGDADVEGDTVDVADSDESADEPPDEVLATVEGADPFGELEITDLRRVDDTVTLEFVLVASSGHLNPFDQHFSDPTDHGEEGHYSASGVTLVDKANNQRHLVLRDSRGGCLCTDFGSNSVDADERIPGSAEFPAPPDDVDEMTVNFPHFPAIDNVPLRQGG